MSRYRDRIATFAGVQTTRLGLYQLEVELRRAGPSITTCGRVRGRRGLVPSNLLDDAERVEAVRRVRAALEAVAEPEGDAAVDVTVVQRGRARAA